MAFRVKSRALDQIRTICSSTESAAAGTKTISKTLSEILVCPLSKQPLRMSQGGQTNSHLISDALSVSFPIVDGIPCLVPSEGKLLKEIDETSKPPNNNSASSSSD